jgi:hypothetical protein
MWLWYLKIKSGKNQFDKNVKNYNNHNHAKKMSEYIRRIEETC